MPRIRELTAQPVWARFIRFEHRMAEQAEKYDRIDLAPVRFGANRTEIVFAPSVLDLPIPTYDPSLRDHLTDYANRLMQDDGRTPPGLRVRIESVILSTLPGKLPSGEDTASLLGLSSRTFARRLPDQGLSYQQIVEVLRSDLAKTFLKSEMTLSDIAFALGCADQALFFTAFKRWTGATPTEYRG